ncbi:MAG: type IV pilin N-terminal domain-containing protein [Thermoplasmatales archaeon]|nr:type IV pilin N-terminal domain-containing protein [Thermoplasmatales archaeon]
MWKIKNKEAVSPVIGVILMVAITVVLAAVLYVWVSGFMTAGGGGAAPSAALASPSTSGTNYTVKIISISAKIDEGKVTVYVMKSDVKQWSGSLGSPVATIAAAEASGSTVCYIDNDGDDLLSTNDLIWIRGTAGGYTIVAGDVLRLADTSGNTIGTVSF